MKYTVSIIFCAAAWVLSLSAHAATYYVDNIKGKDTYYGISKEYPWATLKKAAAVAGAGDTVIILSNGPENPYLEALKPEKSGAADKWLIFTGESPENKPHITANGRQTLVNIEGKRFIEIRNLVLKSTREQGVEIWKTSDHITLKGLEIQNIGKNGILVIQGGSHIVIDGCKLKNIVNTGIGLLGDPVNRLSETTIQNCEVSDIIYNDGISLHKDGKGNDLGDNHIVRNNYLHDCFEQGLDITSGKRIVLEGNVTTRNGDSGILLDHGVEDVRVVKHVSLAEKKHSIVIGEARNISIEQSEFKNSGNGHTQVVASNGSEEIFFINNTVEAFRNPLLDIYPDTNRLAFRENVFRVKSLADSPMIRCLNVVCPSTIEWRGNVWENSSLKKYIIGTANELYTFQEFKSTFATTDSLLSE